MQPIHKKSQVNDKRNSVGKEIGLGHCPGRPVINQSFTLCAAIEVVNFCNVLEETPNCYGEEMAGCITVKRDDLPARGRPVTQMILPSGAIGGWASKVGITDLSIKFPQQITSTRVISKGIFHRTHKTKKLNLNLNNE